MRTTPSLLALALLVPVALAPAKEPKLDHLFPSGGQRGQTIVVKAEGSFDPWPPTVWVEGRGVSVEPSADKGQLSIQVAPDAPPGVAWIRLYNDEGASALRPFVVGTVSELVEVEPNDDPAKAQAIDSPAVTINGRLAKSGDVDGFAVELKAGQTLVASLLGNRVLGSPMDALLQVATPKGFVLAHVDDDHGFDPQLAFTAPSDGTYVVRTFAFPATPNSSIRFAGSDDFIYRLTLTTGGFVDYPAPLAVPRDDPGAVEVVGWNVPEEARSLPVQQERRSDDVAVLAHPALANSAEVPLVPYPAVLEREPNPADSPQAIDLPVSLTGRIEPKGDADVYRFTARKDEKRLFRVASRSLGFPLDPILRVLDANGKVVTEADDTGRDSRDVELLFTAPADGDYRILVRDLNGRGGPRFVYRLDAIRPEPDYRLSVASDHFTLNPDKALEIPVTIALENGFEGNVLLTIEGLPEGVKAEQAEASAGSQPSGRGGRGRRSRGGGNTRNLALKLTGSLPSAWSGPFRILGHLADDDLQTRSAAFTLEGLEATSARGWLTIPAPKPEKSGESSGDKEPSKGS